MSTTDNPIDKVAEDILSTPTRTRLEWALEYLQLDYEEHGPRADELWRSFTEEERLQVVKISFDGEKALQTSTDPDAFPGGQLIVPEINIQDLCGPDPEYYLSQLHYRGTATIFEQYLQGPNGRPGDLKVIEDAIARGLELPATRNEFCYFDSTPRYGTEFPVEDYLAVANLQEETKGTVVPRLTGEMVMWRQMYTLNCLARIMMDTVDAGLPSGHPMKTVRKEVALAAVDPTPQKLALPELLELAEEQRGLAEDRVSLCRTEPVHLSHQLDLQIVSHPGFVPDDTGKRLAVGRQYASTAVLEVVQAAICAVAVWDSICHLLHALLEHQQDPEYRKVLVQELSNVAHYEYATRQKTLQRVAHSISFPTCFRRVAGGGQPRIRIKSARHDASPRTEHVLALCESKTTAADAMGVVSKLNVVAREYPWTLRWTTQAEYDAVDELSCIAGFLQTLQASLRLPPKNGQRGHFFLSEFRKQNRLLDSIKEDVDLSRFVVSKGNLLQPGVAQRTLVALDEYVEKKTGVGMGVLYEALGGDSIKLLRTEYTNTKSLTDEMQRKLSLSDPVAEEETIAQRQEKAKSRPAHSSVYSIVDETNEIEPQPVPESPVYQVKKETLEVFTAIFSKSEHHGSVHWTAFQAAMTELKFSVFPRHGSVYSFIPPPGFIPPRSFVVHRPHQAAIEGRMVSYIAHRLNKIYGWDLDSFQLAT
ncbi:hypothetical protein BJX99DRAFT_260739 [Aspergillus californicus]